MPQSDLKQYLAGVRGKTPAQTGNRSASSSQQAPQSASKALAYVPLGTATAAAVGADVNAVVTPIPAPVAPTSVTEARRKESGFSPEDLAKFNQSIADLAKLTTAVSDLTKAVGDLKADSENHRAVEESLSQDITALNSFVIQFRDDIERTVCSTNGDTTPHSAAVTPLKPNTAGCESPTGDEGAPASCAPGSDEE